MVALRDTHKGSFDLVKWAESLDLPQEQKAILHDTHNYMVSKVPQEDIAHNYTLISAEIISILVSLNMDLQSLQCAILFPAYDNGYISSDQVLEKFGPAIAKLLHGIKDMEAIKFLQNLNSNESEAQVDRVRRMLLSMVDDVRAVVIKLSERIAIIRDAKNYDEETRVLIAKEIANIYAPLANRLGIGQLKWELEDLAFRFLHPQTYKQIAKQLDEKRVDRESYINNFVQKLQELLNKEHINAQVYGRPKHIYSIWRKMQKKHLQFTQLYDVRAVRVVVDKIQDCYAALGVIHTTWHHIPREFDDYIANPKPNGYQSIHTVVYAEGGKAVEIQIRTNDMHQTAELGVAAHWKYKEGSGQVSGAEERINWLRKLLAWRDDMVESGALLDEFRTQVFEDRVYIFTPKGEVIDLPTGSTPLDFAYHVHTMVGHRCIGAKVDGRIVPYSYKLKTGEQVEIITQKEPNPSRDWINTDSGFLKTSKARAKVLSWFRKIDYDKNKIEGEALVEKEVSRHGLGLNKDQVASLLKEQLTRFNMKSVDDLYASVGAGDIRINQVISYLEQKIFKRNQKEREDEINALVVARTNYQVSEQKRKPGAIIVDGVGNLLTHIAKCCQPIPGDDIAGFITQGRGISVHRVDCDELKELAEKYPERLVSATWGNTKEGGYTITLRVVAQDYSGLLRDVTTIIANEKVNVLGVRSHIDREKDLSIIDIDLMIVNVASLNRMIFKINELEMVQSAKRI